jgi:hypothetical protein
VTLYDFGSLLDLAVAAAEAAAARCSNGLVTWDYADARDPQEDPSAPEITADVCGESSAAPYLTLAVGALHAAAAEQAQNIEAAREASDGLAESAKSLGLEGPRPAEPETAELEVEEPPTLELTDLSCSRPKGWARAWSFHAMELLRRSPSSSAQAITALQLAVQHDAGDEAKLVLDSLKSVGASVAGAAGQQTPMVPLYYASSVWAQCPDAVAHLQELLDAPSSLVTFPHSVIAMRGTDSSLGEPTVDGRFSLSIWQAPLPMAQALATVAAQSIGRLEGHEMLRVAGRSAAALWGSHWLPHAPHLEWGEIVLLIDHGPETIEIRYRSDELLPRGYVNRWLERMETIQIGPEPAFAGHPWALRFPAIEAAPHCSTFVDGWACDSVTGQGLVKTVQVIPKGKLSKAELKDACAALQADSTAQVQWKELTPSKDGATGCSATIQPSGWVHRSIRAYAKQSVSLEVVLLPDPFDPQALPRRIQEFEDALQRFKP